MASVPPRTERRARPGSLQRPVNGRLYRGTWLLVGLPLLLAAFSVARPTPLPRAFLPAFDGGALRVTLDSVFPPAEAVAAFQRMRDNANTGKIVIAWR